jgi:hypothetical protein
MLKYFQSKVGTQEKSTYLFLRNRQNRYMVHRRNQISLEISYAPYQYHSTLFKKNALFLIWFLRNNSNKTRNLNNSYPHQITVMGRSKPPQITVDPLVSFHKPQFFYQQNKNKKINNENNNKFQQQKVLII